MNPAERLLNICDKLVSQQKDRLMNNVKMVGLAAAALSLVGCASLSGVTNKMVNNDQGGVIYGAGGVDTEFTVKEVCDAIKNKDPRCVNPDDYVIVPVLSKFGFADGAVGINTLVHKDFPNLNILKHTLRTGNEKVPYVKARVIPGQLGELLEIVSINGEGKCEWIGMPRAGGVVCPAFGYDYRKDFKGVVFR